ncbi:histidine phosphatase family protein [Variovorax ginsengisoli]|uniref:Alpha-ribazole phosphatase n=1 Tax=Variovorax ginsengisoli TaxID=363844 RepID=A0ABT9SEW7_9BURK|nr:histidine phosphatase family protein [Variovorax ginsengisoli]MDP9902907.1 alpha-ribazole phosphatase [Variovorax ginsengisoli]
MKLWLLRHAPVDAPTGLCYGTTDFAAQADATQRAAAAMAPSLSIGIEVRTSPLQRCTQLAAALAHRRADLAVPRVDPRLAELDFGDWEGRPWQAIPRAEIDAWAADFCDARPGRGGESTRTFMQRVGAAWDEWCASGHDALWITHAGVIRAVTLLQRGVRLPASADAWPVAGVACGAWSVVERSSGARN